MKYEQFAKMTQTALGKQKAELVLKNANVVNVFSGEIILADVAISDGMIVGVGRYDGILEQDMTGKTLCPGFVDSHLHFESTLVAPPELIANAVAFGTTTYIADPHESANVCGLEGIDYILNQTEQVPANVFVMMPSCVPSAAFEDNGCKLTADEMKQYAHHPRILGLGEVMDYRGVVNADKAMYDKLELFRHKKLDGHAPFLQDYDLAAYTLAGIATDHECCDFEYAMKERRNGMQILIREGTAAKNLEAIVRGLVEHNIDTNGFCFCTDDKHIEEIRREGHISHCVKKAIALGISPVHAVQMASINAAKCYHLDGIGAIAPGYQADIVVLDDLEQMKIACVYHKGMVVSEGCKSAKARVLPCSGAIRESVHVGVLRENSFTLRTDGEPFPVIGLIDGQILTKRIDAVLPQKDGIFMPNTEYNKIAVIERHKATGHIGVGAVKGFGIAGGAIASSVSHDCHNIIVAGDNDTDMLLAVRELMRTQGGYAIAGGGQVIASLPLPVMGLMCDTGFEQVNSTLHSMVELAHNMGVNPNIDPFITLSFTALPVIPELRLTTRGIYDVKKEQFVPG
ncbi:adenine deaminase [Hydrogenoanaerobacterium sp.]|uniref:adenine deaminase n=1 Tax=Hydrogenoanaerobacterium sp. TaxID=2953763 RepID=UPI00289854D3|nr:adenine deaminase [Hydrogenoanaerobacterium sp.]